MSPRVFTDPREPGAPQPGDVVTVCEGKKRPHTDDDLDGVTALIVSTDVPDPPYVWELAYLSSTWVRSVRWPTPAELAGYQLGQGVQP